MREAGAIPGRSRPPSNYRRLYGAGPPESTCSRTGFSNLRFIHLSDRYACFIPKEVPNRVVVRIGPDSASKIAGFISTKKRLDLMEIQLFSGDRSSLFAHRVSW
ncbi:hypothetical protein [Cryobacterium sp. AP23]